MTPKITYFRHNKKIVCYIKSYENKHVACTGKPSDASCIGWTYNTFEEAEFTAKEYFNNRTNFLN